MAARIEHRRHITQHFEMLGSRAIYHDGWKAVAFHPVGPLYDDGLNLNAPFDDDVWELYHVAEDISEVHDLAAEYPDKVAELVERWWDEARRNDVLPLDNRVLEAIAHPKPDHRRPRDTFRYFPDGAQVPEPVAVNVRNRSHAITVTIERSRRQRSPNGVLLALGSALGGWSLHVFEGACATSTTCTARPAMSCTPSATRVGRHTVWFDVRKGRRLGRAGHAACEARMWWPRAHGPLHPGGLQRRRGRRHVRIRMGSGRGRGLHGAVPVQRDHRQGRGDHHRPVVRDPVWRGGRHPGRTMSRADGAAPVEALPRHELFTFRSHGSASSVTQLGHTTLSITSQCVFLRSPHRSVVPWLRFVPVHQPGDEGDELIDVLLGRVERGHPPHHPCRRVPDVERVLALQFLGHGTGQ